MKSKEAIFKRVTDQYCLLESDLNSESIFKYINLCNFPSLWSIESCSINLKDRALAFPKLLLYFSDQNYSNILITCYIDKLKEIIISNLSNSISLKSYIKKSSQIIDENENNEWWNYFQLFYSFLDTLIIKIDESLQKEEFCCSWAQLNLKASGIFDSALLKPTIIIDNNIIQALIQKFCSEIQMERNMVLFIIKSIYKRMPIFQAIILKQIEYILLRIIHENQDLNGAFEMLRFIYKNISASEYFNKFVYNVLLPLHKVQTVILFHSILMKCCKKFQSINKEFANPWIQTIVKYWPYGNSRKEILFLNELDEALKLGTEIISTKIWKLTIKKLSCEITNPHKIASNLAFTILNSDLLKPILMMNSPSFPTLVLESIIKVENITPYINRSILLKKLRCNTVTKFSFEDLIIFDKNKNLRALRSSIDNMHNMPLRENPEVKWESLLKEAKRINPNLKIPKVPYQIQHVPGLANMNDANLNSGNLIPSVFLY